MLEQKAEGRRDLSKEEIISELENNILPKGISTDGIINESKRKELGKFMATVALPAMLEHIKANPEDMDLSAIEILRRAMR